MNQQVFNAMMDAAYDRGGVAAVEAILEGFSNVAEYEAANPGIQDYINSGVIRMLEVALGTFKQNLRDSEKNLELMIGQVDESSDARH